MSSEFLWADLLHPVASLAYTLLKRTLGDLNSGPDAFTEDDARLSSPENAADVIWSTPSALSRLCSS